MAAGANMLMLVEVDEHPYASMKWILDEAAIVEEAPLALLGT